MSVERIVADLGHVAERRQVLEFGGHVRDLAAACHRGSLHRVRRAWYADAQATLPQQVAVRIGGVLGGPSAAASHGLWTPADSRVHVSLASNASRLRVADAGIDVVLDWTRPPGPLPVRAPTWRVDPATAVVQSARHLSDDDLVAMIDSALHTGRLTRGDLSGRIPLAILAQTDASAESGIESLVRVRLRRMGMPVRTQVVVPGVGRLDLVVGDRLVIETDGREHHALVDRFTSDRRRDLELMALGLIVLRLTYAQVVHEWPSVEDAVRRVIDRGDHRSRDGILRPDADDMDGWMPQLGVSRRSS